MNFGRVDTHIYSQDALGRATMQRDLMQEALLEVLKAAGMVRLDAFPEGAELLTAASTFVQGSKEEPPADRRRARNLIEGLTILAMHAEPGQFCGAEHDILFVYVSAEALPADSDDGRKLETMGFRIDDNAGNWAYDT